MRRYQSAYVQDCRPALAACCKLDGLGCYCCLCIECTGCHSASHSVSALPETARTNRRTWERMFIYARVFAARPGPKETDRNKLKPWSQFSARSSGQGLDGVGVGVGRWRGAMQAPVQVNATAGGTSVVLSRRNSRPCYMLRRPSSGLGAGSRGSKRLPSFCQG